MKKEMNEREKETKEDREFLFVLLIIFTMAASILGLFFLVIKEEIKNDKEEKKVIEMSEKSIEIKMEQDEYHIEEKETPFRYILSYKINNTYGIVEKDKIYVYNPVRIDPTNDFFCTIGDDSRN